MADKNAGPFRLEVSSIRAEKATAENEATARSWADSSDANKDIVETAAGAGQFNTLVQAVGAAGLVDALKRPGPFTVFAPTDGAFAKLPEGTVERDRTGYQTGSALVQCWAATYEVAVESLLKSDTNAFSDKDRSVLQNALRRIRSGHQDASEQAWTLRRALDVVYRSLSED